MPSFRLQRDGSTPGLFAIPLAVLSFWLLPRIRTDLGENDISGLLILLVCWVLLIFAIGLAVAGIGFGWSDWRQRRSVRTALANLAGGVFSLLLVAIACWW